MLFVLIVGPVLILCLLIDPLVHRLVAIEPSAKPDLEDSDTYQVFRQAGWLLPWIFLIAAFAGHRWWSARWRLRQLRDTTTPLAFAIIIAGGVAELLKRLIGKERPGPDGEITFKPLLDAFSDDINLGLPSSHAAVAFAAAFALARLYPGSGIPLVLLAIGTGFSRIYVGAHFLSDVVAGAAIAYATVWLIVRRTPPAFGGVTPQADVESGS